MHLNAFSKNWRYGGPGHALAWGTKFSGSSELATAKDGSSLVISNSGTKWKSNNPNDGVYVDSNWPKGEVPDLRAELPDLLARWNLDPTNLR